MTLRTLIGTTLLSLSTLLPTHTSFAAQHAAASAERVQDIAFRNKEKRKLMNHMARSIKRHKRMTLEGIKADLEANARQNVEWVKALGNKGQKELSAEQLASFNAQISAIRGFDNKAEILAAEERFLSESMSSENYLLLMSRAFWGSANKQNPDGPMIASALSLGIIPLFILTLDIITFPVMLVSSLMSGF